MKRQRTCSHRTLNSIRDRKQTHIIHTSYTRDEKYKEELKSRVEGKKVMEGRRTVL